jgi:3-methyl-2-oxobutanoate hydroxymethyltransferase
MVVYGYSSTLPANIDMMRSHTEAVARGAGGKMVVSDMPFLSYRKGVAPALDAAQALMSAGAHAIKLEGVEGHEDVVQRMTQSGIPVMGHIGLQPQSVNAYGGYRIQGRGDEAGREMIRQAVALQELGAFAVVLECIPAALSAGITAALRIPTIGIGAGAACDGQILVLQDLLGMNLDMHPKFVRRFADGARCVTGSIASYDAAVKSGAFPAAEESYL